MIEFSEFCKPSNGLFNISIIWKINFKMCSTSFKKKGGKKQDWLLCGRWGAVERNVTQCIFAVCFSTQALRAQIYDPVKATLLTLSFFTCPFSRPNCTSLNLGKGLDGASLPPGNLRSPSSHWHVNSIFCRIFRAVDLIP